MKFLEGILNRVLPLKNTPAYRDYVAKLQAIPGDEKVMMLTYGKSEQPNARMSLVDGKLRLEVKSRGSGQFLPQRIERTTFGLLR